MKPPSRRRSAPARYDWGATARVWTEKEKRRLLTALRAQAQGPLQPKLLKKYLPSRDEAEVGLGEGLWFGQASGSQPRPPFCIIEPQHRVARSRVEVGNYFWVAMNFESEAR